MLELDRRKELKLAYKQTSPPMGVYQIKNPAGVLFYNVHFSATI